MRVQTPGMNYVVPCGFSVRNIRIASTSKIGLRIGGQDGPRDERGNVVGHGCDPTGRVDDIREFVKQVYTHFTSKKYLCSIHIL